ncbi:unnamed protein product [Rhodiola kirilowii]
MSDKSFNKYLHITKEILPHDNNYPSSYKEVKILLKNMGLGYETIHACEYGCILYYKENKDLLSCPVCGEARYDERGSKSRVPKKTFGSEMRNVRLGLATDGFNPFGASGHSHSTRPIVLMPYNLPPHMCMKKEMNILCMLIFGPKSPGKCLNVFMRPLIDELKMLWEEGVQTYDRTDGSSFIMKAAVMWTISDFPGLGMLGGIKTKGYKACPLCLDEIDATHITGRMSYQGHQRWLPRDHDWRFTTNRFNGEIEHREPPTSLSGTEIFAQISSHDYPTLSLHPKFEQRGVTERLCWTHILEGKTKDDIKARKGLEQQGVRRKLWYKPSGSTSRKEKVAKAPYTVTSNEKVEILELIKDAKYPSGYAGSLRNKINLDDKKFIELKTHDCHVMLQRLLPVFIQPYLPFNVVN